jgi:hypothetical protein
MRLASFCFGFLFEFKGRAKVVCDVHVVLCDVATVVITEDAQFRSAVFSRALEYERWDGFALLKASNYKQRPLINEFVLMVYGSLSGECCGHA